MTISAADVESHRRARPAGVRAWGSKSVSSSSDDGPVLQIDEEQGGAFAAAVSQSCMQEVKGLAITARFRIIALRSIICIGFLRSRKNAAQPSVSRDVLELRPSELVDLCACRSNGEQRHATAVAVGGGGDVDGDGGCDGDGGSDKCEAVATNIGRVLARVALQREQARSRRWLG